MSHRPHPQYPVSSDQHAHGGGAAASSHGWAGGPSGYHSQQQQAPYSSRSSYGRQQQGAGGGRGSGGGGRQWQPQPQQPAVPPDPALLQAELAKARHQLQGKCFHVDTSSCVLPDVGVPFSGPVWQRPDLMAAKRELNATKDKLDHLDIR